ncbi:MAG: DUF4355 domain-containing protein [Huintestinicola sp.]
MSEEFKIIDTQEAFDAAIKSRLERNTRTVTEEVTKKYEGYLSPEDAAKSSEAYTKQIAELNERLKGHEATIADLTAKNKAYETNSAKMKIAHETGIPFELADKLSGETEEEIRADAEKLAKFTARNQASPLYSSEVPVKDSQKAAFMSMLQSLNKK